MTRHLYRILAFAATFLLCGKVWAQEQRSLVGGSDAAWTLGGAYTRAPEGQETGYKLSDTTLMHLGIGAEGGFDTNVFYSDVEKVSSPMLRITPFIELTNATRMGAVPSGVYWDLSASLQYREYISDNSDMNIKDDVNAQRAFNPSATALVEISSGRTVSFSINDTFSRLEEPPYTPSEDHITRDVNVGSLQLKFAPGGGRLRAALRYTNVLDLYETDFYKTGNSMGHEGMVDGSWLWLPKTAIFIQVTSGYIQYLEEGHASPTLPDGSANPNPKYNSVPLRAVAGLRGLLTQKLSVHLAAGYATAWYEAGPNTSGASNVAASAELKYLPTAFTELTLGYRHEFVNSFVGNFYDVDAVYLGVGQRVLNRLNLLAHGKYELRRYGGMDRTDNYARAGLQADYYLQEWLYGGVGYYLLLNRTNAPLIPPPGQLGGVEFTKQQILFRLGVVY